ncbi:hypothetical protein LTR10_018882 [Elasticomyces elasticus]|uniref:Uncharacterized protein n=1 Tax=Exophiala sideris TaxID=1016849 RepID=A0ABR0JJ84_9EURO|nr:hypothetical protein LTR10_018882 [Elasticomyces elasticus]KAK5034474.1 hypothetical protein LTS07_003395 [Exophiala sideris]KAK5042771.1 hypothetical protein LTR13_001619 [Exophiala sideris]KAK5065854.1 hypothetical protein LTR69_003404 [Exophiala sideris]KAK5185685.1 hypothetical protein LTR44_001734 [Eurotiomycetes sp. CCFEE 6388]
MDLSIPNSPFRWESASGLELVAEYSVATGTDPAGLRDVFQQLNINNNPPEQAAPAPDADDEEDAFAGDEDAPGQDDIAQPHNDDADDAENLLEPVITEDTTQSSETMPPPKLTKAEIRAQKKAAKSAKSQSKAAKNQKKHTINVRGEDVTLIARILHGDSAANSADTHPLASDKEIDDVIRRNIGYVSNIETHKKQLLSSIAQKRRSDRRSSQADEKDEEWENILAAILSKLGIDATHISASVPGSGAGSKKENRRSQRSSEETSALPLTIVANLKVQVKEDLERFVTEQKETCVRAGAFWRYAGKPIFDRMTRIAMELDWKTGMKLKQREE